MNSIAAKRTKDIKNQAKKLGFLFCGISKAEFLEKEAHVLEDWLAQNYNGEMAYMANYFDKRLNPQLLVPGSKSVISCIFNYYPEKKLPENSGDFKISKYAYGQDYHHVFKEKLKDLMDFIKEEIGEVSGRIFVDSAPVMEKVWAEKSGIGWIGKNTNLISKNNGSFFFIGEIICDLELEYDSPIKDFCGTCTACIDACPTDALFEPYKIDASKCISYLTIELKGSIPIEQKGNLENWIFGCDICQDVCPWNRFSKPNQEEKFQLSKKLSLMKKQDWLEITEEIFNQLFEKSAVKRTKFEGLKRNIAFNLKQTQGFPDAEEQQ